ncbi:hypothetical protein PIB30_031742 [Stylosanthes scabra]|uniref:Uncharacterized protein n=1 Tax=Stylosanthes scabra TaxID=79078 RepID=A0ABU6UBT5_9FABA|nr:hypothetical protein [Stylosanthes scabra]
MPSGDGCEYWLEDMKKAAAHLDVLFQESNPGASISNFIPWFREYVQVNLYDKTENELVVLSWVSLNRATSFPMIVVNGYRFYSLSGRSLRSGSRGGRGAEEEEDFIDDEVSSGLGPHGWKRIIIVVPPAALSPEPTPADSQQVVLLPQVNADSSHTSQPDPPTAQVERFPLLGISRMMHGLQFHFHEANVVLLASWALKARNCACTQEISNVIELMLNQLWIIYSEVPTDVKKCWFEKWAFVLTRMRSLHGPKNIKSISRRPTTTGQGGATSSCSSGSSCYIPRRFSILTDVAWEKPPQKESDDFDGPSFDLGIDKQTQKEHVEKQANVELYDLDQFPEDQSPETPAVLVTERQETRQREITKDLKERCRHMGVDEEERQ